MASATSCVAPNMLSNTTAISMSAPPRICRALQTPRLRHLPSERRTLGSVGTGGVGPCGPGRRTAATPCGVPPCSRTPMPASVR
jgi:hypothetical protein